MESLAILKYVAFSVFIGIILGFVKIMESLYLKGSTDLYHLAYVWLERAVGKIVKLESF